MRTFERLDTDAVDWEQLDALLDRTVYQTRPWLDFIARAQNAEPVVAVLREGNDALTYLVEGSEYDSKRYVLHCISVPFILRGL
jgi:hypothetical protein